MAPFVDAVLMVARAEKSKRSALVHAVDQLYQVGADVVGGVLNDVPISRRTMRYGYGYGYGFREEPDVDDVASTASRTRARTRNGSSGGNGSGGYRAVRFRSTRSSPTDRSQVVSRSERAET